MTYKRRWTIFRQSDYWFTLWRSYANIFFDDMKEKGNRYTFYMKGELIVTLSKDYNVVVNPDIFYNDESRSKRQLK